MAGNDPIPYPIISERDGTQVMGYIVRLFEYNHYVLTLTITVDNELCVSFGDHDAHKGWYRFGKYSTDHGSFDKPLNEMVDIAIKRAKDKIDKLEEVYNTISRIGIEKSTGAK